MGIQTAPPEQIQITDRDKWDGDVVATRTWRWRWGTHSFHAELQVFADGDGHLSIDGPDRKPPSAREIVADGLDGTAREYAMALVLADEWDIDTTEVSR